MPSAFGFRGKAILKNSPFVADITAPSGGVVSGISNAADGAVVVSWGAATDPNGVQYEVYLQPHTAVGLFVLANVAGISVGSSLAIVREPASGGGIVAGRTYHAGVRAVDRFGNRSANTTSVSIVAGGIDWDTLQAAIARVEQDTSFDLPAFISAGLSAINQSASRRIGVATSEAFEQPDTGSVPMRVQVRTFDGDGAPANATALPTVSAYGGVDGNMNARLGTVTLLATGIYEVTFTVQAGDTVQQLAFEATAIMADGTFGAPYFGYITNAVSVDFTSSDRSTLNALAGRATEPRLAKLDGTTIAGDVSSALASQFTEIDTAVAGLASALAIVDEMVEAIFADPSWMAKFANVDTDETTPVPGSVCFLAGGVSSGGGASDHPLATN